MKSDDVTGRTKTYEAIVKGQNLQTPGVPESFKVLVKELQSLALDIRLQDADGQTVELSALNEEDDDIRYADANEVGPTVVQEDELESAYSMEEVEDDAFDMDDELLDFAEDEPTAEDLLDE